MEDKIKFRKKLGIKNNNLIMSLPKELIDWLGLSVGQEIILSPDEGKYGRFIALYIENNPQNDTNSQPTEEL